MTLEIVLELEKFISVPNGTGMKHGILKEAIFNKDHVALKLHTPAKGDEWVNYLLPMQRQSA